jgi:PAS domain S-box-containing protein
MPKKDNKYNSENLLMDVFNRISDGIIALDSHWNIAFVNQKAASHLNRKSSKDLLGKHIWMEFPEKTTQPIYRACCNAMDKQESVVFEEFDKLLNKWFENRVYPSQDGLTIYVIDITDRKRSENTLLQTQFTVDNAREGVLWIDESGRFLYVNNAVCSVLGYSKEELAQMKIFDIDLRMSEEIWPEQWKKTIDKREYIFETIHKSKEGKIIPVEISVSAMNINGEVFHCSFIRDITERKIIEKERENDNYLFRALIDNLPNAVFVKDKNYRRILYNSLHQSYVAYHLKSLGIELKCEILGKTDFEIYPKEFAEKYFVNDQKVIRDGEERLFDEEPGINPYGQPIWQLVSKIPLRDNNGEIVGLVGITTDITAQKKIELALQKTKEELIKINKAQQLLSRCNKILIRATSENQLLNDVCNVIVETGKYNFAWVGYTEGNGISTIRPVAKARLNDAFLSGFKVTPEDTGQEHASILEALRSSEPIILRGPFGQDIYSPWFEDAVSGNYISLISLPIKYKENTFGILNVYSSKPDSFSDPETLLLKELSDDLAFGIVTLRDKAKKIMAEKALQVSEERLGQAIRVSNIGIFDHDHITDQIQWSEHMLEIFGWKNEVSTINEFINSIYPEDKEKIIKAVSRAHDASGDGRFAVEHRIIRTDGAVRWLTTRSQTYFRNDGNNRYAARTVGASLDITENKLAEQELQKLYVAIEQSPASVVITNTKGEIEYVNAMFTKMSGFSSNEIKGKQLRILKKSENQEIWDLLLSGSEWKGEYYNKNKDGSCYWESTLLSPIISNDGIITNFLAIQEDISDKKKTYEELKLAKEIAEEANRVKDVFLANMSHELRTPLIVILGYSQLFSEISNNSDILKMADGIRKGGIRLLNTLNSILDLTRIGSDRFELDLKIVDLLDEIKNIYESFRETASTKKIDYSIQILQDHLYTNIDLRIFDTILKNLLDNAYKFTNIGSITIICGIEDDNMVFITVKDTGIGIAEIHHESIFEEFHQVSEGINRDYQGLGLGLAITKKYVEILGGNISVESQLGTGSSFTIRFPSAS